jgi:NO-binding membrane sensor protein with MHYT domain
VLRELLAENAVWIGLADLVLLAHLAYLAFLPTGGFLAWRWPQVLPAHIVAVVVGLVSITIGFDCPLTSWEQSLRRRGGRRTYTDGFVDHYLTGHVYPHGYAWLVQLVFALCVVASYTGLALRRRSDHRTVGSAV